MSVDSVTNGESHRARALRLAETSASNAELATVHALLAVEEQLRNVAYYASRGGDVRRMDADDNRELAAERYR